MTETRHSPRVLALKPDTSMPDEDVTLQFCLDNMVISGSPRTVLDRLVALVDALGGPFGTLLLGYKEWDLPAVHQKSWRLMADNVMPQLAQLLRFPEGAGLSRQPGEAGQCRPHCALNGQSAQVNRASDRSSAAHPPPAAPPDVRLPDHRSIRRDHGQSNRRVPASRDWPVRRDPAHVQPAVQHPYEPTRPLEPCSPPNSTA